MSGKFNKYLELRRDIDTLCDKLYSVHSNNMLCAEGCSSCCMDFGILAIEFNYIKDTVDLDKVDLNNLLDKGECPFLVNKRCSIYQHRPIICRTHGFPLLQMGEDSWELSVCDLNFTQVSEEYFSEENCYPQDLYNSKLYLLNQEYLSTFGQALDSPDLFPLSKLVNS